MPRCSSYCRRGYSRRSRWDLDVSRPLRANERRALHEVQNTLGRERRHVRRRALWVQRVHHGVGNRRGHRSLLADALEATGM